MLCMGIFCFPCAIRSKFYFFYSIISAWRCFCQVAGDDSGRVPILRITSKRIIYISKGTAVDTKNRRSYNESKSPGQKRKGAILMEQQKMLMEKMLQTLEQLSMEDLRKVYAFIRALLEIRHE